MSPDEVAVLVSSGVAAVAAWFIWYLRLRTIHRLGTPVPGRRILVVVPVAAAAVLLAVLQTASAHDVRDDPRYLTLYFLLGAAWVGLGARCLALAGVSVRDDALERANRSAAYAVAGALLAITLCFAGGNIGDGPGWWVVVFSAGLATISLFVAWLVLEVVAGVSEVVTIDRDDAAGVRLAGFLVACGLIFGRAAAGDWVSADATVVDFLNVARAAVPLVVIASVVEWLSRPTPQRAGAPIATHGAVPAVLYVAASALYVMRLGLPG
jgi:hypothetical protein